MTKGFMKGVATMLGIAILAGGVCATGYASRNSDGKWFKNSDLASWHWSDKDKPNDGNDENNPPTTPTINGVGGGAIISNSVDTNGLTIYSAEIPVSDYGAYGISAQADTAYVLTATVQPTEATNKAVTYTIDWENANSAWASGKQTTSYVTVTQPTSGSLTANVTCLQPFAEPLRITCTSQDNPSAKSYVTVNYVKKLIGTSFSLGSGVTLGDNNTATQTWYADSDVKLNSFTDNFSIGTKNDAVTKHYLTITTSSALQTELAKIWTSSSAKTAYTATRTYTFPPQYANEYFSWNNLFVPYGGQSSGYSNIQGLFSFCSEEADYGEWEISKTQFNKLIPCLKACSVDFVITVKTELSSGAIYSKSYNVNVADSVLKIGVTSVGTNTGNIDF